MFEVIFVSDFQQKLVLLRQ